MNFFRDGTMRVVPYCYAGDGNMVERPIFSTEIAINGLNLKNRFVMCSMVTNYAAGNGEVTDELIRYHEERARGGCALNMLEATYISREGNSYFRGVGISDDYHIPGLKRLTDAVHACGGKIGVQLQHGGRTARPAVNGQPMLLVSCIPGITAVEESREMTADDIHRLVESYRRATVRAMAAGFDAVEIHAAHGYLLAQFLSPHTNRRTDDYGGSPENRLRFPMEVMDAVREAAGPEYPVIVRLSVEEFVEPGITLESAAEAARMFVEHGADADIETLRRVDAAETYIRHLGFKAVRVRVHGGLARIELEPLKIREFCALGVMEAVSAELKKLGFKNVALDIDGYKRGAMNG